MKTILMCIIFILFLTGCSTTDNVNYFDESSATEDNIEQDWLSEKWEQFSNWLGEKIDKFDATEEAESLPPSVYKYDVEKDFPLEEGSTEEKKSVKEYWDGMWKEKDTEE